MGAFYTVAALAFYRWSMTRTSRDAVWALLLASSCALIKTPGIVWALTLVPGAIIVLLPRHGTKIVVALFAVAAVALVALAKFEVIALGYRLQLDFQPAWYSLFATYFLFGNWNLLWYMVIVLFALGWRSQRGPKLVPLTAVVAAAFGFLFLVFAFTNAAAWVADFTTVNRATLHFAPLLLTFCVLLWNEILHTPTRPAPIAAPVG